MNCSTKLVSAIVRAFVRVCVFVCLCVCVCVCVCVCAAGKEVVASSDIRVSDILVVEKVRHRTHRYLPCPLHICSKGGLPLELMCLYFSESADSCRLDFAENDREKWLVF